MRRQRVSKLSHILDIVVVAVLAASPAILSGCSQEAAGQSVSQSNGSTATQPVVSAVFRAFTRPDSTQDTQALPDTSQPSDATLTLNQADVASGALTFEQVFDVGDELFATQFTSEQGIGANLANDAAVSVRFSRSPRADLAGFLVDPFRSTGPNARGCVSCHELTFEDGAGGIEANVHRDPQRTANPAKFIQRNTPHVFGLGALQLLAEEATADLKGIRDRALTQAQSTGAPVRVALTTRNNVSYGFITAQPSGSVDTGEVAGVDPDLVVRPFQWKGSVAFVRDFVRDASNNELGMQPVETYGADVDADHDGVSNELTVGQITGLTVYQAAQPRPVTIIELNQRDRAGFPLTRAQKDAIQAGEQIFSRVGCAGCHMPVLKVKNPIFAEPSASPDYRDATFPSGANPIDAGVDPAHPVKFDLTVDSPDDIPFESDGRGGALVKLFGDLKRHDMGPGLAESIDEVGTGPSVWRTRELWGVGSTGPWLHDGRATTLRDAILFHGGEGQASRDQFAALSQNQQAQVVKFLQNLVLFKAEEDAPTVTPHQTDRRRRH